MIQTKINSGLSLIKRIQKKNSKIKIVKRSMNKWQPRFPQRSKRQTSLIDTLNEILEAFENNPQDSDNIEQVLENLKTLVEEAPDQLNSLSIDELQTLLDLIDKFTKIIETVQESIDTTTTTIATITPAAGDNEDLAILITGAQGSSGSNPQDNSGHNREGEISNLIPDSFPCHAELLKV